tara:strand:- start:10199 stop:11377 length:1179 start_codon:yes stop_codon:yes gene_type:complete
MVSLINGALNFVFISYFARELKVSEFGLIGLIMALTYLTVPLSNFGTLELVGINVINYSSKKFITFFNTLNTYTIISKILVVLCCVIATLYYDKSYYFFFIIFFFTIVRSYVTLSDKILIAKNNKKKYFIEKLRTGILTLIFGFFLLLFFESWYSYFIAILLAELISIYFRYSKYFSLIDFNIDKKVFLEFFKYGLPFMIGLGGAWMLNQFDKIIVEEYFGAEVLGGYSLAFQIGIIIRTFNNAITNAMYPILYSSYKNNKILMPQIKFFLIFLTIGALVFFTTILFTKYFFIDIYGVKYEKYSLVVILISLSFVLEGLYRVWDTLLTYKKKNYLKTLIIYMSSILGLIFTFLTLDKYGFFAPAYGVVLAYFSLFIFTLLSSLKITRNEAYN